MARSGLAICHGKRATSRAAAARPGSSAPRSVPGITGLTAARADDPRGLPPYTTGLRLYGPERIHAPFGEGDLCVGGPLTRLHVVVADQLGGLGMLLDHELLPLRGRILPGDQRHFQLWYRDPAGGPAGFNSSDALSIRFTP